MWACLPRIFGIEGADMRTSGYFDVVVVQGTLLFRSEMWVVTPHMAHNMGGFHHWVVRHGGRIGGVTTL